MKNGVASSASLLVITALLLSGASRCKNPPPPMEFCLIGDAGCICHDPRLPKARQDYTLTFKECVNKIATNAYDYHEMRKWCVKNQKKAVAAFGSEPFGDDALYSDEIEQEITEDFDEKAGAE